MKSSQLLVTATVVLTFPLAASAQHGAVRAPHAASGGQNQQQQQQQMLRQQQQALKQQQQMQKTQQHAIQQQVKSQQKALAAQQKNAAKAQQGATRQQTNAAKQSIRKGNKTGHAQSDALVTQNSAAKKPATTSKKDLTARERREHEMEEKRIARAKRWDAFERWLRESDLLRDYEARFRAKDAHIAMEEWLARQESLRARGLAVDPLFTHYRSFMTKYKP
jgi:hypothetical protein